MKGTNGTSSTSTSVVLFKFKIESCLFARFGSPFRTYAHNTSITDPSSEPHSFSLENASARMLEVNQAAGEYTFEIQAELRTLQFRTNQQQTAENWVNWVTACSNEKRYQDTLKQLLHTTEEGEEEAESVLNDAAAMEKKISAEIVKRILSSYFDIVRKKLIDAIPKVGRGNKCVLSRRLFICS